MVNTFLPYPSFIESAKVLDYRRLNKQILECDQILKAIEKENSGFQGKIGWVNHPATKMWKGYEHALKYYRDFMLLEWVARGYNSTRQFLLAIGDYPDKYPPWRGNKEFHASHRSNLLRKDPIHYGQFGWTEPNNLEYVWPV